MAQQNKRYYTRDVPIDSLIIDSRFAALFLEDPALVKRLAKDMKANGFDPGRPLDVWAHGAGRDRHILIEGHQRLTAAKQAGLTEVKVIYRRFAEDGHEAQMWAAEQQTNRRNTPKEVQALGLLQILRRGDVTSTRAELSERFGIGEATFGRAAQVLNRGIPSEIVAVEEGTHSLKETLELIKEREAATAAEAAEAAAAEAAEAPVEDDEPEAAPSKARKTKPAPAAEPEDEDDDEPTHSDNTPEALGNARDMGHTLTTRVDRLMDLLEAGASDVIADAKSGRFAVPIQDIRGLVDDIEANVNSLTA